MQVKPEHRKNERFGHEYIIMLGAERTLSPHYVVSYNLSQTGMYFKSIFELHPGSQILIGIDDYTSCRNQVHARVMWCKKIENGTALRYGVGVEFLQAQKTIGAKAFPPFKPPKKSADRYRGEGEVVTNVDKRLQE
ncbi:MAG: PilZ domain-containing protein [Desulfobacterales bacterium]|nr:PilZ domain-containing protein [Desulfobacterales bacterium]